jgi:hypothetical protein
MMKVNFLALEHRREPEKNDVELGVCDPDGELYAYTTTDKDCGDKWCATIKNLSHKHFVFVAVDKNIPILKDDGTQESRCDGMIYVPATRELSFVELKDYHVGGYLSSAEKQLRNTLKYFLANHNYKDFHNRKAYACNPRHPQFAFSARQQINEFRKATHFNLMPQATIIL